MYQLNAKNNMGNAFRHSFSILILKFITFMTKQSEISKKVGKCILLFLLLEFLAIAKCISTNHDSVVIFLPGQKSKLRMV